jgi:hypothetical protein
MTFCKKFQRGLIPLLYFIQQFVDRVAFKLGLAIKTENTKDFLDVLSWRKKNISNHYRRSRMSKRRGTTMKRRGSVKRRRRNTRSRRRHQRGGYAQYQNNQPLSPGYSVGGHLPSSQLALANPPPITRNFGGNCVDNYNHFTNTGFPSRGH